MSHATAVRALVALLSLAGLIVLLPAIGAASTPQFNEFSDSAEVLSELHFQQFASYPTFLDTVVLSDGRVLLLRGNSSDAPVWLYDPVDHTTTPVATTTNSKRFSRISSSTMLTDGSVLVIGWQNVNGSPSKTNMAAARFDPVTGTFIPTQPLTSSKTRNVTATRLLDGRVLVVGGFWDAALNKVLTVTELYDPTTNSFTATGTPQVLRRDHTATLLSDGRVLIAGGRRDRDNREDSAEIYDPSTGSFSLTGSMLVGGLKVAAALPDGQVLLVGPNWPSREHEVQIYDPVTGTFSDAGPLLQGFESYYLKMAPLADGRLLLIAPVTNIVGDVDHSFYGDVALYDPVSGTFSPIELFGLDASGSYKLETVTTLSDSLLISGRRGLFEDNQQPFIMQGTWKSSNTVSGTLLLPAGWITNTQQITVGLSVSASGSPITQASVNGNELPISNSERITTTISVPAGGASTTIHLAARDTVGHWVNVVSGTVLIDTEAPTGAITEVRREGKQVTLELSASDEAGGSGLAWMRVGLADELEAAEWRPYAASVQLTIPVNTPGTQHLLVEFRDRAGNRSATSCRGLANQRCLLPQLYLPVLRR